ncbi:DUF397 domain-containing protein [Nocardia vermiculata]|uniref:DUF397 domain-containing protein n=1 Tax=Nocardia vermiculata TaxID=257274 RepID=A0A846XXH8_9NOCA|nr:DUF397 domain-containing protein [Nocardia vermiculata]NKY48909.1 DUF397 domain-containing protein [Nocardia vermiculata]
MTGDRPRDGYVKSSFSEGGGNCVEVAFFDNGTVGVRDSKDRSGPVLRFTPTEWDAFVRGLRTTV